MVQWTIGDKAHVKRGRTKNKGKSGLVFAVISAPYHKGWQTDLRTKLGIALSNCVETPHHSARGIQYKDRIWEWAHNCDRVSEAANPGIEHVHERARVQTQQRLETRHAAHDELDALPLVERFRKLCEHHDLTYQYSDDHSVWKRGNESRQRIEALARQLPREDACRIWNEVVDKKLAPAYASDFYWKP